jgi:hypothetical protein
VRQSDNSIINKTAYIKILFLTDGEILDDNNFRGTPVMMRTIRNSRNIVPIFDTALYYVFTKFNNNERPRHFEWIFTSEDGKIDDAMQIYPFDPNLSSADPGKDSNEKLRAKKVDTAITDNIVTIAHWYNAFRKNKEWAGARADDDTSEMRVVVDFTSVITAPGKENSLFRKKPEGFFVDGSNGVQKPMPVTEYNNGRIFSTHLAEHSSKDDVLKLVWETNWENLGKWQGLHNKKLYVPNKGGYEPPL